MPRKKQNVGLEHGGDYGTVQATADSMNPNMGGIPLAEGEVAPDLGGAAPPVVSNTPAPSPIRPQRPQQPTTLDQPLPIEAAQAFTPKVKPLTAPGQTFGQIPSAVPMPSPKQEAAVLVSSWASATGDPLLAEAAAQLANG